MRREEREPKSNQFRDPIEALNEIAEVMPALAVILATENNVQGFQLNDEQRQAYEGFRRKIALEYLNEQRSRALISPETKANGHIEEATA